MGEYAAVAGILWEQQDVDWKRQMGILVNGNRWKDAGISNNIYGRLSQYVRRKKLDHSKESNRTRVQRSEVKINNKLELFREVGKV